MDLLSGGDVCVCTVKAVWEVGDGGAGLYNGLNSNEGLQEAGEQSEEVHLSTVFTVICRSPLVVGTCMMPLSFGLLKRTDI